MGKTWTCSRCRGTFAFRTLDGPGPGEQRDGFTVEPELEVGGVEGAFCRACAEIVKQEGVLWEREARRGPEAYRRYVAYVHEGRNV